jgi:hypothetical protein
MPIFPHQKVLVKLGLPAESREISVLAKAQAGLLLNLPNV